MMTGDDYRHFVCIVAGDDPDRLMADYDMTKKVPPYAVYKMKDAEKIKKSMIEAYKQELKETDENDIDEIRELKETIEYVKGLTPEDAFKHFTYYYDKDPITGDAISTDNPNGRWDTYNIGKLFSVPFYTNDGREVYQELKSNINWPVIHGNGKEFYSKVWDMVMEGDEPTNEKEKNAYENMKDKQFYFQKFGDKNTYVASNTAFWGYAFLSEETGWIELTEKDNQFVWMSNFFDVFIKILPEDTKLTILECRRL